MAATWQNDPLLVGKFHPKHPDDLEVVVHEGGPRLSAIPPELMWVRLHDVALATPERRAYRGVLLNRPYRLPNVQIGEEILVLPAKGSPHPIRTTALYLEECALYDITPCKKCGFSELFDPPSALIAKIFPNIPEGSVMERFTTFCPLCGGVQEIIARAGGDLPVESDMDRTKPPQRWLGAWKPPTSS